METKVTTSQPLGNAVLGVLMARVDALNRDLKGDLDNLRGNFNSLKGEVSTISERLDSVESRMNSRPSIRNPYHVSSSVQANNSSMTMTPETLHQMLYPPRVLQN